ncbi:hypothetical protein [Chryseobacterium pennipullorum]|uniref:Cell wall anchor protein n=1 Tax=Chryseobacterium pennipullorum TaxID=2258963 RepID=A0A3D9B315_9FLAO|nr:hypothetical protein [Chryseobacterium pennipullorum]REC48044.1 hypothetical protein DRF67_09140 [Chryseobacterium pennipullorum]
MKTKLLALAVLASAWASGQQTFSEVTIESYSPTLFLKRNTDVGGFVRGIQTKAVNGENGWFFGDVHGTQWVVSKGDHQNRKLVVTEGGDVGIGTVSPGAKLDVNGNVKFLDLISAGSNSWIFHTPDDTRKSLHIAPRTPADNDWDWGKSFIINGENGNALLNGKFEAKEVKVTAIPTADFVFDENYNLPTLEDVEKHIKEKKHLPEIASAKVMEKEGVNVGEFQIKLLQKIEELTLYSIEQNKNIKQLQEENRMLKSQADEIKELKKQLRKLVTLKN